MTALVWQSLLLLGVAYALGCWIGCLARRMITLPARTASTDAVAAGAAIAGAAAAGAAIRQAAVVPQPPAARQPPATPVPVRDAFRRADTLEPVPGSAPAPRAAASLPDGQRSVERFERALAGLPNAAGQSAPARSASARRGPDDLKRIRMIDAGLEAALHKLGVRTFAEIGTWKSADVTRISQALGFKGRIEQQNWIEQAQILATGRETYYSSRLGLVDAPQSPARVDHKPPVNARVPAAPAPVRPPATPAPASGPRGGVEGATATAAAMAAAAAASRVPPPVGARSEASPPPQKPATAAGPVPTAKPAAIATPPQSPPSTPPQVAAASAAAATPPSPDRQPVARQRDNLQRIQGVTSDIEKLLNSHGVTRFGEIARWQEADIRRFGGLLGQPARIQRENWIAQAARLERAEGQPSGAEKQPSQPVMRVPAPSVPVPGATSPPSGGAAAKPIDQPPPGPAASVRPDVPTPPPAGTAGPRPPAPPAQQPSSSVPVTKPAPSAVPSSSPPATGTSAQALAAKPPETGASQPPSGQQVPATPQAARPGAPVPAGTVPPSSVPPTPAATSQPAPSQSVPPHSGKPSVPGAGQASSPSTPPASQSSAGSAAPQATPKPPVGTGPQPSSESGAAAKPVVPPSSGPTPTGPSSAPAPSQPAATSVPVTKPAGLQSTVVASASMAGAAVASLASAGSAAEAARPAKADSEATSAPASASTPASAPSSPAGEKEPRPADPLPAAAQVRDAAGSASRPEPESRSELAHLRSVRSEGMRGLQGAADTRLDGEFDDLKRIRGIGVLIEKKLNSMGVTRYEQIAKWTSTDIDRVSHVLDFKGRIERENWVEQARILASGGQTEFSRRADRGEFGGM